MNFTIPNILQSLHGKKVKVACEQGGARAGLIGTLNFQPESTGNQSNVAGDEHESWCVFKIEDVREVAFPRADYLVPEIRFESE